MKNYEIVKSEIAKCDSPDILAEYLNDFKIMAINYCRNNFPSEVKRISIDEYRITKKGMKHYLDSDDSKFTMFKLDIGKNIEDMIEMINTYKKHGMIVEIEFNGEKFRSDKETPNSLYIAITGMPRDEFIKKYKIKEER